MSLSVSESPLIQRPEVAHEGDVVLHLRKAAHAGEHHQHPGKARGEADGIARGAAAAEPVEHGARVVREVHEVAALDRLHDDDGLAEFAADLVASAALHGGIVVVGVVERDLHDLNLRIVRQDIAPRGEINSVFGAFI